MQEGLLGLGKVFWSPALERLSGCQALSLSLSQPGTRVKLIGTEVRPEEELVQPDPEQNLSSFRALRVPFLEVSLIRISRALEFTLGFLILRSYNLNLEGYTANWQSQEIPTLRDCPLQLS